MAGEMEPPDGRWLTSTEASVPEHARLLPDRIEPGELLAQRFRIIRILARGGMGLVLEAMDEELRTPVALKLYRDQSSLLRHINCRGEIASMQGEWRKAEAACSEALELARVTKYRRMISVASNDLATAKIQLGELDSALDLLRESVAAARELGDPNREPFQLLTLAQVHARRGDLRRAALLLSGARALLQSQGMVLTMADKDLAREVEAALQALPAEERDRLRREGTLRSSGELMQIGFSASSYG